MSNESTVRPAQPERAVKHAEKGVKAYQSFAIRLIVFLLAVWVLFFQVIGVLRMPSTDMYPRVDGGDLLLFYRLDKDVKPQDIIVIEKETPLVAEKQTFVCRVVAVAGDTLEITDGGNLVVNGNTILESNIFYSTPRYEGFVSYPLTLGEDECFVLADKRDGGTDSRFFGPVNKSEIDGTVITILRRNNL